MFGGGFDFGNMFHQPQFMYGQRNPQYGQQPNAHANGPPPVSKRLLNSLPIVVVTADDLLEETNKECAICLSEIKLGMKACKLPCGHLYDRECLKVWLEKHCTCPVCRFELETDDAQYESQRKCRMKSRKLRYRLDELQHKKISELREISSSLSVNISGCIDKSEIIDLLVASNKIEITEGAPNIEIGHDVFHKKGVGELRQLLLSFGISDEGAIEKNELRERLLNSGRIILIDDNVNNAVVDKKSDTDNKSDKMILDENITIEQLFTLDVRELKLLSSNLNVNISNCLDKRDITDNILASGKIRSPPKSNIVNNGKLYEPITSYSTALPTRINDSSIHNDNRIPINLSELNMMNIRELKFLAEQCNVKNPTEGCVERSELVFRIRDSGKILVLNDVDKTY